MLDIEIFTETYPVATYVTSGGVFKRRDGYICIQEIFYIVTNLSALFSPTFLQSCSHDHGSDNVFQRYAYIHLKFSKMT